MNTKQQVGESFLDWKHRLLISKMNKEIDKDWHEIRDILGLECSADHLRKLAYGIVEYHNNIQSKKSEEIVVDNLVVDVTANVSDDIIVEIEEKTYNMEKMKFQLADQRRELNNVKRWEARLDDLEDLMLREISLLAKSKPIQWSRLERDYVSNKEGVLLLSDWHRGLFTMNHWNKFDDAEFERRIVRITEKTVTYGIENNISTLNVFGLGDFVNGIIHVTTRISNSEDVVTQTMRVCEILSEMLAKFAKYFNVKYYHARGNHDRVTANKHDEIAKESFADFIPFYLKARLAHIKAITFIENEIDDEMIVTEICGKKIFAVHGHRDRISNVVENLTLMTRIVPDYVFMGHYHHHEENEVQGIEVVINSSFSGVDTYAKEIRKTSNPAQKFMIFDNYEGRLCTYNIRLNI